ncbi:MAG: formate dehydrogenase subunit gamma [Burkholderiaceae bacterium]
MQRSIIVFILAAIGLISGAWSQAPGTVVATGGIQSQSIFEVRPDASTEPGYSTQSNAARAQVQPLNNAPMWRKAQGGVAGYSSLPADQFPEAGVLIQPPVSYFGMRATTAGEAWREVRNRWIIPYGGALLLIVLGALFLMYFAVGPMRTHGRKTGRSIERFTPFERSAHWANAIAFVILAISGLTIIFGRYLIAPWAGNSVFGPVTYVLKTVHNFVGPLFVVSLLVVIVTFIKDNFPQRGDWAWIKAGGGMFGGAEAPSHRFNAGEKLLFWGAVLFLGSIVVASGLVLDHLIPNLVYDRQTMQLSHMVHAIATVLMMGAIAGHIYIGTLGMEGAYHAMRKGWVDETWAREHHGYWYQDVRSGRVPVQRSRPLVRSSSSASRAPSVRT